MDDNFPRTARRVAYGIAAFIALVVLWSSWYTIDQGHRGVLLQNGAFVGVVEPGLHFKLPMFQSVEDISTRQGVTRWSDKSEMQAYSRDQQPASMVVSVNYHVPAGEVSDLYSRYQNVENMLDRIVRTKAPQAIKTVFGQFDAVSVIQNRAEFNRKVAEAVQASITDGIVVIDGVQVENIDFSAEYEKAVEARMTAQVDVQKQQQQLEKEKIIAEIALTQATGRANSVKAEADANAYKVTVEGNATANAIRARGDAVKANPLLVELTATERWDGKLPTSFVPGSAVPFITLK